jgi:hypothetical protein
MRGKIRILDPTVRGQQERAPLPPKLPALQDRVLGLRIDKTWASYTRFAHRIAELARQRLGVKEVRFFDPGTRIGTTEEERRKVAGFVRDVDAAIVGLGT